MSPRRIGILAFERVDLLDLGGPYEVFLTASRLAVRAGEPPPFEVVVIGATTDPIRAYGGLALVPHIAADAVDRLDVLIVPGAVAIDEVAADPRSSKRCAGSSAWRGCPPRSAPEPSSWPTRGSSRTAHGPPTGRTCPRWPPASARRRGAPAWRGSTRQLDYAWEAESG